MIPELHGIDDSQRSLFLEVLKLKIWKQFSWIGTQYLCGEYSVQKVATRLLRQPPIMIGQEVN